VSDSRGRFSRLLSDVLAVGAAARDVIAERLPLSGRTIALYDGFGFNGRLMVQGRVLRDERIPEATPADTPWTNLAAMLRRADADAMPFAKVRVLAGTSAQEFVADDEGFFSGWMDVAGAVPMQDDWVRIGAELHTEDGPTAVTSQGRALVPAAPPNRLVISDIDDTVLQSKVTNLLLAVRTIAFGNARTRLPFPGVAAFYHALRRGATGNERNPLYYVSSSPWNLYDVIRQFLEVQGIPGGPIMLRDLDLGLDVLSSRHHHLHKREMIRRVLSTYPSVPAVLIGDSGQQDPEIYRDVVREYPGRIAAVYIRNVTMNDERSHAIQELAEEVVAAGSALLLADDTLAAARHAAEHGFIDAATLSAIADEKKADEGVTGEKQDAPGARDAGDRPTPTVVVEPQKPQP